MKRYAVFGMFLIFAAGCVHYPVNQPLTKVDPESGYRGRLMGTPGNSKDMVVMVTFSGGGTRAAAFSYGVLEELRDTEVIIKGEKRRLLDEVDGISAVSGGSFTAAYYGLYGDRIFEDFETRFLKKNVQGALTRNIIFNPYNWARLFSPYFDRSDLAAEYYDDNIFDGATFGDMAKKKGPMVLINATDMITGIRIAFQQDAFDFICSDLSSFKVSRAVAASSAVPMLLSPVTIRNYAGNCNLDLPKSFKETTMKEDSPDRQYYMEKNIKPYLDSKKKKNIHLVDGGVSDNLGLRAVLDRILVLGDIWESFKHLGIEDTHKVVFIVVNAETAVDQSLSLFDNMPSLSAMLKSYSSVAITRYNFETVMLLRESFDRWKKQIRDNRCAGGQVSTEQGACGDIEFYVVEVKFDALKDEAESSYFKGLPTTFKLPSEDVDKLRQSARKIISESKEFKRLLDDLGREQAGNASGQSADKN